MVQRKKSREKLEIILNRVKIKAQPIEMCGTKLVPTGKYTVCNACIKKKQSLKSIIYALILK